MNLSVCSRALRAPAGVVMLTLSAVAVSAPTLVGTTTDPTGINGLVVDGVTYDVTFSTTTFDSPFTLGTAASEAAAKAIASVFSTAGVTELGATKLLPEGFYLAYVDNGFNSAGLSEGTHCELGLSGGLCSPSNWVFDGGADFPLGQYVISGTTTPFAYSVAANFTQVSSSVPEPTTLALFGLGFVGIALSRRRRTH
jgi:PEP-CTERM motif